MLNWNPYHVLCLEEHSLEEEPKTNWFWTPSMFVYISQLSPQRKWRKIREFILNIQSFIFQILTTYGFSHMLLCLFSQLWYLLAIIPLLAIHKDPVFSSEEQTRRLIQSETIFNHANLHFATLYIYLCAIFLINIGE